MTFLNRIHHQDMVRKLNFLHRTLWAGGGLLIALLATTSVAAAAPLAQTGNADAAPIWSVLLPVLTASVAVERAMEVIWNYIDWAFLNFRGMDPADLKSPQYVQFKSGTSLLLGVVAGILIANFMGMRIFAYFAPLVPGFLDNVSVTWDVVVTGVIIGAGSKPAHDILGILTKFKDFLDKSAIRQRELAGAAFSQGVLNLAESETQNMVDVPGAGPTPMGAPMPMNMADEEGATGDDLPDPLDRYAQALRERTAL
ncbi:MAG: hypothetical protein H6642_18300 [Caldilineaceae bacterium]|nr:hypothetical protein [Caldilineaceae bacterium]MCB9140294.1 hypothetical protein [Caldilineaceae bacterium]